MNAQFRATHRALEHFDRVDQPAFLGLARGASAHDEEGFVRARRAAADRVRAAFTEDSRDFNTPENIELLSVEVIRRAAGGTPLGRLLAFLP